MFFKCATCGKRHFFAINRNRCEMRHVFAPRRDALSPAVNLSDILAMSPEEQRRHILDDSVKYMYPHVVTLPVDTVEPSYARDSEPTSADSSDSCSPSSDSECNGGD